MKLTSTTFFLMPFCDSSVPNAEDDWELSAACKNLRINQFEVAPRMEETSVKDESGRDDTYGARRGGSGGCEGMVTPQFNRNTPVDWLQTDSIVNSTRLWVILGFCLFGCR